MDPISISAGVLGAKFLEEGAKFLWEQAGNIIERYHARKDQKETETQQAKVETKNMPDFLESPTTFVIDFKKADEKVTELVIMKNALEPYLQGKKNLDSSDTALVGAMNTLQMLIEAIYNYQFRLKEVAQQNIIKASDGGIIEIVESKQTISKDSSAKNIVDSIGKESSIIIGSNIQEVR